MKKATKEQQWKAGVDRNQLRGEMESLNLLINVYNLQDAEDAAEIKKLLQAVRELRAKTKKYLFQDPMKNPII